MECREEKGGREEEKDKPQNSLHTSQLRNDSPDLFLPPSLLPPLPPSLTCTNEAPARILS